MKRIFVAASSLARTSLWRSASRLAIAAALFGAVAAGEARAQSLTDALALAYSSNPTLEAARAELRAVNEGVPQAISNWRPQVTLNGSIGRQREKVTVDGGAEPSEGGDIRGFDQDFIEYTTPIVGQVSIDQNVWLGGQILANIESAEAAVLAQRALLQQTEQEVLLQAVTAYANVWRDQSVLELTLNNEAVLARQLEASRDRFEVGEITRTDVAQSESRLAIATAERVQAEGQLAASRGFFQEVIGIVPNILNAPVAAEGVPAMRDETVAVAIQNFPGVTAAVFNERSADRDVRSAVGALLPAITVGAQYQYGDDSSARGVNIETANVTANVSVPLYQGGGATSTVREAKQIRSLRRLEIAEQQRAAENDAILAWERLITGRAQIQSFQASVEAAEIALEGVREENAVGARTVLDILDAEQELLDTQVSLVRSQRDAIVASYEVLEVMGRLTAQDLSLPVALYRPEADYDDVRDLWWGLDAPEGTYTTE